MVPFFTLMLVVLAGAGIFALRALTSKIKPVFNKNSVVDFQIKFQSMQLVLAAVVLTLVFLLNRANFAKFFRIGDVNAHVSTIPWLGITGTETWLQIALTIGLFVTLGTVIFMFFQLKNAGVDYHYFLFALIWSIPFSITNAFSEEAIFRLGIVSPLYGIWAISLIVLLSAVLFGIPHYFGMPSGVVGVLMAGFLGWLLAMSLVKTQGFLLAWGIHFVQDVVIITSVILMSRKKVKPPLT
jgi:membrane protease YdiL (CAAX protease family)